MTPDERAFLAEFRLAVIEEVAQLRRKDRQEREAAAMVAAFLGDLRAGSRRR